MTSALWTTSVGSFPKAPHLQRARTEFAQQKITARQLQELEREATREWVRFQEERVGPAVARVLASIGLPEPPSRPAVEEMDLVDVIATG